MKNLEKFASGHSIVIAIGGAIIATTASYYLALGLRLDFNFSGVLDIGFPLVILLAARHAGYIYWQLYSRRWRYVSTDDIVLLLKAHVASSTLLAAALMMTGPIGFPRSVIGIEFFLSLLFAGGSRLAVRLLAERLSTRNDDLKTNTPREVLILGAGTSGHLLVKTLLSQRRMGYNPIAVLDDSDYLRNTKVHGIEVLGALSDLSLCLERMPHVAAVIAAIPSLSGPKLLEAEETCCRIGVPFKRLQSFDDIACIDANNPAEPLTVESLLQRDVRVEHEEEIRSQLRGKRILVTGAGGSIGSELVRQLIPFGPAKIILYESSEFNLFKIERECSKGSLASSIVPILGSIVDASRLSFAFEAHQPEIIFHAAAYKHVPLLESNPHEAFRNNIVGTRNVLRMCVAFGVKKFVMISTDKAVAPSSIMGCSKRVAEFIVQGYGRKYPGLETAVVRFGNVINSAGSVVPTFREQILSGGPVTVTHPEMERYFMSIREAVRLTLTAGTLGERGEIYILDMGTPIKIVDVARKMLALYGRRDVPIVFTGVRPGEKLKEELTDEGELKRPTHFAKVFCSAHTCPIDVDVERWIDATERTLYQTSHTDVALQMMTFVHGITSKRTEDQLAVAG